MKLEKIKVHVDSLFGKNFSEELKILGQALGHKLPKKDLKALAEFRSMLAISMPPPERYIRNSASENGYIRGYVEALQDVASTFSAETEAELQLQEDANFLREAGYVPIVVALLGDEGRVKSAVELANELAQQNISADKIEEDLAWLVGPLVEKLEFENQRAVYRLNLRGEKLANMLKSESK
ncbi:MAG: hypothetical protein G01um101413_957 [Parcubacteria group bacterium Gr01-1014_13]|nr:MAG: hypothetical protein G01um101413_957 [Parcubacteria group bacterium Gr01-1014_13]